MAKYKKGINGPFSGKIGPVTGSSWKGTPYIKSNDRVTPKREPSEAQLNQRMMFAMVSRWLRPMKEWIELGYADAEESKLPMNAAISFTLREVLSGVGPDVAIDYPKMVWSRGELLASVVTVYDLVDGVLYIEWLSALPSWYNQPDDHAVFMFYSPATSHFAVFDADALRGDGAVQLQLPPMFESSTVHGWMFCKRHDQVSTSVYLGAVIMSQYWKD